MAKTCIGVTCAIIGTLIGITLTILGIVFGIFACVPAGPFEDRDLGICVSFVVLSVAGVVCLVPALIGVCCGIALSHCGDDNV